VRTLKWGCPSIPQFFHWIPIRDLQTPEGSHRDDRLGAQSVVNGLSVPGIAGDALEILQEVVTSDALLRF
jgi:hypothetical protein